LQGVGLDARAAAEMHVHGAIYEAGIAANTHMPFYDPEPRPSLDLQLQPWVRRSRLCVRAGDKYQLEASGAVGARGDPDGCAVCCERLIQKSEARVRKPLDRQCARQEDH